jgi:uncharacterized protein (DUF488 family)
MPVFTVGHSNQASDRLIETLLAASIELVVDVRAFAASRYNPQFNRDALAAALLNHGIEYRHLPALGGRRQPAADSPNTGLRDASFRGFADYMQTPAFDVALSELIELASRGRIAIMCAEALPWRCHRSLIADALVARGVAVTHLLSRSTRPHALSPQARVEDGRVTYPALL